MSYKRINGNVRRGGTYEGEWKNKHKVLLRIYIIGWRWQIYMA